MAGVKKQKNTSKAKILPITIIPLIALSAKSIHGIPSSDNISLKVGESPIRSFIKSNIETQQKISIIKNEEFSKIEKKFIKNSIFKNPSKNNEIPKNNNIIVIFTEGFSARWTSFYGGVHEDLMPNFDAIAQESVALENYFNHTAATFRGLRGQLLSSHQSLGGFSGSNIGLGETGAKNYYNPISASSLPKILKKHGYTSYFYLSQQNKLNEMLETLDFDAVHGRDDLAHSELHLEKIANNLSDQELFEGMLKSLIKKGKNEKFFAALYNFDTHAFLDGSIPYKNGKNAVLNRFHTYDTHLGDFIKKFKKSSLYNNTTLIITADHATFPDAPAKEADPNIPRYFIDKIPFIIHSKGIQHKILDADNQTSITFAPTLLSLLKIKSEKNMFFGCSLLDHCNRNYYASIGSDYFTTKNSTPELLSPEHSSEHDKHYIQLIRDFKKINNYIKF